MAKRRKYINDTVKVSDRAEQLVTQQVFSEHNHRGLLECVLQAAGELGIKLNVHQAIVAIRWMRDKDNESVHCPQNGTYKAIVNNLDEMFRGNEIDLSSIEADIVSDVADELVFYRNSAALEFFFNLPSKERVRLFLKYMCKEDLLLLQGACSALNKDFTQEWIDMYVNVLKK